MITPRFIIYARKSTDDLSRQVRSIDDQIAELRDLARREQLDVVAVLIEKQTAKAPGRPVFNDLLARVERGEVNGILAWHPDRLARNSLDGGRVIHLVDAGKLRHLRFPTFPFEPSASGKFMLSILFGQSKYYVDNLSENIRRGQRQKLRNGIWPVFAPVGYMNDHSTRTILPDPHRAPLVRRAFELYASGTYTLDRLTEAVNVLGMVNRKGEPLSRAQYHRMLRNPLYYGVIRFGGEDHEGRHEPIVSKGLFDAAQAVTLRKTKPKTPALKPYLYRGVFRCGACGCAVTTETQKGHNYLRCTKRVIRDCPQPYVREELVVEQVRRQIVAMAVPVADSDALLAELEAERGLATKAWQQGTQSIRERLAEADGKLDRLMQAYLDAAVSLEEFRAAKGRLVEEKADWKAKLTAAEENRGGWFEPAIRFAKALKQAGFLTEKGTDAERRDFLRKYGSNLRITDRKVSVEPRQPWQRVVDQGSFARNETPAPHCGAGAFGETRLDLHSAEWAGFVERNADYYRPR